MIKPQDIIIPADVPNNKKEEYIKNYLEITKNSGNLFIFACDQKAEHLNDDFYGEGITLEDADPKHLFEIASKSNIGVMAGQLGLVSRYASLYPEIPYMIKLNSKTHLVKTSQRDPISTAWIDPQQVIEFKKTSGLNITSLAYTIFVGSEYEPQMLREVAQMCHIAHQNGLVAVVWGYIRGKAINNETDPHLIAGSAGLATCLGADFVKVNPPKKDNLPSEELLKEATKAAGLTKVVCAGGSSTDTMSLLTNIEKQMRIGGAQGTAIGRNIHQRPLKEAINICNAIDEIVTQGKSALEAAKSNNL